jgi:hypothetical protein
MVAFIAKLPWLTAEHGDRVVAWGEARYDNFRLVETPDPEDDEAAFCIVGGFFREPPRSMEHLQRLVNNNLNNWGIRRRSYQRGWLRIVPRDEAMELLGLNAEAAKEHKLVTRKVLDNVWAGVAATAAKKRALQQSRREKACLILAGLAAPGRSLRAGLEALVATTEPEREQRAAKTARFNSERYGLAGGYVSYSRTELDECSDWPAVKRRRLSEPDPRRDRQDHLASRAALEQASQTSAPVV